METTLSKYQFKVGDRIVVMASYEPHFGKKGTVTKVGLGFEDSIIYFKTDCGPEDYLFEHKLQLEHVYDSPLNQELR